jgi:restriction system protein
MWEKRISHPGLKTFRVIRGMDQSVVELKAKLQAEIWDERWRKILRANEKREKDEEIARTRFQQKEFALQRTREAEEQRDSLTRLVSVGTSLPISKLAESCWSKRT